MEPLSWREAWEKNPGPRTKAEFITIYAKGFAMGIADIIPGVSGGTIAFITGIYENLLDAVGSLNKDFFKSLLSFNLKQAIGTAHLRFMLPVGFGILSAIFSLARVMHFLMGNYPVLTWSAFFGLIAASILVVFKELKNPKELTNLMSMLVGAVFAYIMVSLIPVSTPESSWFIFLCGVIGISAMILPGLSGSFLLLILGKYEFITGAVKNPFNVANFTILITFAMGAGTGLLGFSRLLNWFLKHYRCQTMAFLTGILIGSMKKIWPWREVLETSVIRGKVRVLRDALIVPQQFDAQFFGALALIVAGFILVMALESYSSRRKGLVENGELS
jgi:putative membrane protein